MPQQIVKTTPHKQTIPAMYFVYQQTGKEQLMDRIPTDDCSKYKKYQTQPDR